MNDKADKPPSISGSGAPGLISRVIRAVRDEPWSRHEIQNFIQSDIELDAEERSMLSGVLEVSETQVREIMVPRSQMVVINTEESFDVTLKLIVDSGHSRFPVICGDRDEVLGILLAKDLLRYYGSDEAKDLTIKKLLRSASVIPESKRLNALLKEFRASHNHMAIVVDEYGSVSGLCTIEDVLEEIVGEIDDEHDHEEVEFIKLDVGQDGTERFIVRALTRIEDFNDYFECDLDDEEYDTIGGLLMHELGRLPGSGEKIEIGEFKFVVLKADGRRIDVLKLQRNNG
ncbi:MAG: magnesium/cobalt efflux protein [Gammaproteobacteria bacterium]|nr:magnesium/cobalt efflux protein [Gammaproteobacteria bacterium]|tara:strand:- start:68 stop:928 length:861 start_codon:yes stop_codon:yes gene_type:complete